jgi:hypothetical protein
MCGGRRGFGEDGELSELREDGELRELSELREDGELGIRRIFGKTNDERKFYNQNNCIFNAPKAIVNIEIVGMDIDRAIEEAEKLLLQANTPEVKNVLRKTYLELLKKKFGELSESEEPKEPKEPKEPEKPNDSEKSDEPKEQEEPKKPEPEEQKELHAVRKFKIDKDIIQEIFKQQQGRVYDFFKYLAKYLQGYFKNNKEMQEYIKNKCYVALRVKVVYSKGDGEEQVCEYFVPHQHKRIYLAQRLSDLTDIMIDQFSIIDGDIAEFIRNGSGYVVTGIESIKLEVTPFKPGIRKVRGYIPLYLWLRKRKGIVNIQNKDNLCFWKCL